MKCKHGIYNENACAVCKDWPSLEKMQNLFPGLTADLFLVMTPAQRVEAVKTGVLQQ
jgi:hypothetical protein